MAITVEIISDPSGCFGVDGVNIVARADAAPGIYPVTIGVILERSDRQQRAYAFDQWLSLSADSFVFSEAYLAENSACARIVPGAVLDFGAENYWTEG